MRLQRISTCAGLLAGSLLAVSTAPAQAFSFFTTNFTGSAPKGDLILNSVELTDGTILDDFTLVSDANIVSNDLWTGGNSGAASSDLGDNATIGIKQEAATNESIVTSLANLNLNSIIDTEETGSFVIDLAFADAFDTLLIWERGANSKMDLQLLDDAGNAIGNLLTVDSKNWLPTGYSIDTQEIGGAQTVTALALNSADFGVSSPIGAIRVASRGAQYNGPDWKVMGASTTAVPEPASVVGLGLVAAGVAASRRKLSKQA
jgi:hypothetical protein